MQMKHPGLLENFAHFKRLANGKRLTVFLDYDGALRLQCCCRICAPRKQCLNQRRGVGTLTPIVKNPDRAFMSDQVVCLTPQGHLVLLKQAFTTHFGGQMREAVRMVARLFPTAIISGRGREKVEGFVKLKELYYAGSHGMDIVGPQVTNHKFSSMCLFTALSGCACADFCR